MASHYVGNDHSAEMPVARVVPPLAPARSDEDGSALPAFIAQSVDTPWWQEAKVTTPALLGAVVVVALLLCVVVATVNRANRRVCAVLRDNANALAALAVAKADQLSTSEAADVAAAVAAQMNRAYYEQLIAAVEHALAGRGYRFGHDAFREATLPLYVVLEASRVFVRAQIKYLYPLIRDADLDKKSKLIKRTAIAKSSSARSLRPCEDKGVSWRLSRWRVNKPDRLWRASNGIGPESRD